MRRPPSLQQGDTIMIVAPAGPVCPEKIWRAKQRLEALGLVVWLGQHIFQQHGFLAGEDVLRLRDLQEAITNPQIKAIFCARGGYGSARLLPYLDTTPLLIQPKIFWGYSDLTFLHIALQQVQLITFHGPMMEEYGEEVVRDETYQSFAQLFTPTPLTFQAAACYRPFSYSVRAPLVGGNLTVLTSTLGTPYEIDTTQRILLLEDVGEEPYRIDRLLNQLRLAGKFEDCVGIIFTNFHKCEAPADKPSLSLQDIIKEQIPSYLPILNGFSIGHCKPNYGIPLGTFATMNGIDQTLTIEPGVQ